MLLKTYEKQNLRAEEILNYALKTLPLRISGEIFRIGAHRPDFPSALSEIRIRLGAKSAVVISGDNVHLMYRISEDEMMEIYDRICEGSPYSKAREAKRGYISMGNGIRVGICAKLSEFGIPEKIYSFAFRMPSSVSENAERIFSLWDKSVCGTLIYSLPGGGKTSALRSIGALIAEKMKLRVVIIDERGEFIRGDYLDLGVDVISGYSKSEGLEMALRSMSAEVVIVDEIGNLDEAEALLRVGRGGIPIIASAHAGSFEEVVRKRSISMLTDEGYFKLFIRLYRENKAFCMEKRYI